VKWRPSSETLPFFAMAMAMAGGACGPLVVKAITAPAPTIVFFRMWCAVPVMFLIARFNGQSVTLGLMRRAFFPAVFFAISVAASFEAFQRTSVINSTLLPAMFPLLVMLVARRVFGDRMSSRRLTYAIVAFVGVAAVVIGGNSAGVNDNVGNLYALAVFFAFAAYTLFIKHARNDGVGAWAYMAAVFTIGALMVTPWSLMAPHDFGAVGAADALYVVLLVGLSGLIGHGLTAWASKFLPVTVTSLMALSSPVLATLGAWIIYSERPGNLQLIGGAVVMAGLAGVVRDQRTAAELAPIEAPAAVV
jgi:drug/metabolite transporter (DMT)-like permease